MDGHGIIKGLMVSCKRFIDTYLDDIRWFGRRYRTPEGIAHRMSKDTAGLFTVQYPEEKLPVPEEFRFIPFLVYEEDAEGNKIHRCTSCGICSKVCPPQCIWIVRTLDPKTGRPVPEPAEFYIDIDVCMNCGFCAEFCPFDAIKMDHDYEIAVYDRLTVNIYDKAKLSKPLSYYAMIRPSNYQKEEMAKAEKETLKAARKASGNS
ncbi:MAG: 4Fe-4S binding protein [Chloroflexi bacterium]|nr:4Fe-4S binding protein [Chloroflexota bacterium]